MKQEDMRELRARLKPYLYTYAESHCEKHGKYYVCPVCGSGTGAHHTSAFRLFGGVDEKQYPEKWFCHSCGSKGDLFDLIGEVESIGDAGERLKRAVSYFGTEEDKVALHVDGRESKAVPLAKRPAAEAVSAEVEDAVDLSAFFAEARKHLPETNYPEMRGLSDSICERFGLGFAPAWRHPKAPDRVPLTPRLIIPTGKNSYLARDVRPNTVLSDEQKKYAKSKVGTVNLFNVGAIDSGSPVFLVEGEIDAMSIEEVGGHAVALGSTSQKDRFVDLLLSKPRESVPCVILCLDNDKAGDGTQPYILDKLTKAGYRVIERNVCGDLKDPNDALISDRDTFSERVFEAEKEANGVPLPELVEPAGTVPYDDVPPIGESAADAQKPGKKKDEERKRKELEAHSRLMAHNNLPAFLKRIEEGRTVNPIPTGFPRLDAELNGGLRKGLYVFGAVSSLGKTTFLLQLIDQIAQDPRNDGRDVLIFSLEMTREDLMAKSISRHSFLCARRARKEKRSDLNPISAAVSQVDIQERFSQLSTAQKENLRAGAEEYSVYSGRIFIDQGEGGRNVYDVVNAVERHIEWRVSQGMTPLAPIVVVDYLQILYPPADLGHATDKQIVDRNVNELLLLSKKYEIPVLTISSFNRTSYTEEVSMASFKESGAIEYSADVLIGLQFAAVSTAIGSASEKSVAIAEGKKLRDGKREVELIILKQRSGNTGEKIKFDSYPVFNYFQEQEAKSTNPYGR